jgi:excisionase family DNA binding protein
MCTPPDPAVERTISVERAAQLLGANRRTIYKAVKDGKFPAVHVGGRILVPTAKFLEQYRDVFPTVPAA